MNEYKVSINPGSETNFKYALRSFDPSSKITPSGTSFLVQTTVSLEEVRGFTSVKSVEEANHEQTRFYEEPMHVDEIHRILKGMLRSTQIGPSITEATVVTFRDLDGKYEAFMGPHIGGILGWKKKYPITKFVTKDFHYFSKITYDQFELVVMWYRSSKTVFDYPKRYSYQP